MKRYLIFIFILPLFVACNDGKKEAREKNELQLEENDNPADTSKQSSNGEIVEEVATEKDGLETGMEEEAPKITKSTSAKGLEGKYTMVDAQDSAVGCSCYCLDVSFSNETELCISPEKIYISARFSSEGNRTANVYFVEALKSEGLENEIPWDKFDKTTPVATLNLQPDGSMKLDWLGFSIAGEIAVDYAIYGKKTLEGTYKRQ